jgi:hypothetical protein
MQDQLILYHYLVFKNSDVSFMLHYLELFMLFGCQDQLILVKAQMQAGHSLHELMQTKITPFVWLFVHN